MAGRIDARLAELGIELPEAVAPLAQYVPYVVTGNLVFISGQVAFENGELPYKGKIGKDLSVEDGAKAARLCALNILAQLKAACGGDLDKVKRVVKLGGFVASTPDFTDQPQVMNGCSSVLGDVFGDAGRHARFAVGLASLPLDSPVEVDAVIEIGV